VANPIVRLFSCLFDAIDYAIMSARLRIVDWIYGPEPPTPVDRQRETEKGPLQRAFPQIDIDAAMMGDG
jgi:hypothetical protein